MALLRNMLGLLILLATAMPSVAAERTIIILDASGSMWGQIDGKPKQEIARTSLKAVLQTIPASQEVGFMAYGHREKGSCEDIELIVPPQSGSAGAITTAADNLKFLGKTPLTAAVRQAAEALKSSEDKAKVILITDGLETCEADPCALGKELAAKGIDFTVDVVGFGLSADEGKQVACLAENTGGKYIQASDEKALKDALTETVAATPAPNSVPAAEPEPVLAPQPAKPEFNFTPSLALAPGGDPVKEGNAWEIYKADADGSRAERLDTHYNDYKGSLEAGSYVVVARLGEAQVEQKLVIEDGKTYDPAFILNAGTVIIHPRPSANADVDAGARVDVAYPGGNATNYGNVKLVVPAGEQKIAVSIGTGSVDETVQLAAGQTIEKDMVVGIGHVVVNALYAEGGERVEASGISFRIVKAQKKIDGSRDDVERAYGPDSKFDLPPGDYVAVAELDQTVVEQPFTVKAGEASSVTAILNGGVLAMSAPGAHSIELFSAKKDIEGKRKSFGLNYGDSWQQTMPAGDYVVVKNLPDDGGTAEATATVTAGERTEVTVP